MSTCHLVLPLVAHCADLHLAEEQVTGLELAASQVQELAASQVQELAAVTTPYYPLDHQDFHQVVLAAALELDPPASVLSAGLKVTASPALACQDISAPTPFMEVDTLVPALLLDSAASSLGPGCQAMLSDQAVVLEAPASAREADLDTLPLAWVDASGAAALSQEVDMSSEAFPADPLPISGASNKPQAPMGLAETTVDMGFPVTATVMMLLVWAAATDWADTQVLSMVHSAAMALAATLLLVHSEAFTVKAPQVLLAALDLALSNPWALEVLEAQPAVLAEQVRLQVDQAPAPPVAAQHPDRRKLYVN